MRAAGLARVLGVLGAIAGCGDHAPPPPPAAPPPVVASLEAPSAGPADVVVARVDGRPVWGSCVAAQAAGQPDRRRAALDECVALELGAQEAERRGLDRDPDVIEQTTRALVARLVDVELTARVKTIADLPRDLVDPVFAKQAGRMHRPELRSSFFVRIELPAGSEGTPEDRAAEAAIRAAHASLAGRKDLFPVDLERAVSTAAGAMKTQRAAPDQRTRDRLQPYYGDALYAVPAVGMVTPPVRGRYGWDIILYTDGLPALETSREDLMTQLFAPLRPVYFERWSNQLGKAHQVEVLVDATTLRAALGGDDDPAPAPASPVTPPR